MGADGDSATAKAPVRGESRWPMAIGILCAAALRLTLPHQVRLSSHLSVQISLSVAVLGLLGVAILADPGRIDNRSTFAKLTTAVLIGALSIVNAISVIQLVNELLVSGKVFGSPIPLLQTGGILWATNVISFGLLFWDLDRGGPAARANATSREPAFIFPEMTNAEYVEAGWYPKFVDYLFMSFSTATAFSPTDVSAVKPWAKLLMMAEEVISLVLALLVVGRAVNLL